MLSHFVSSERQQLLSAFILLSECPALGGAQASERLLVATESVAKETTQLLAYC